MIDRGRAMRVRSPLIKVGDWITDGFWIAHRTVPLYSAVYDHLPGRDGQYRLGANGATRRNETFGFDRLISILLNGELLPALIVEQAPPQTIDLIDAGVAASYWEPWYVESPESPGGLLVYDGACAVAATYKMAGCEPIDGWALIHGLTSRPALVGLVGSERRFCVVPGVPDGVGQ